MTNKEFKEDKHFRACCKKMDIGATKRQASKFRNKKGLAYKANKLVKEGEKE